MTQVTYAQGINETNFVVRELWWQTAGLSYTKSGYGSKIPTRYVVNYQGRFHRVYCVIYSNVGSLYIIHKGSKLFIPS